MEYNRNDTIELTKQKKLKDFETKLCLPRWKNGEGCISQRPGIDIYILPYREQTEDLPYSTEKITQYCVVTYMEKNLKRNGYTHTHTHTHTHTYTYVYNRFTLLYA